MYKPHPTFPTKSAPTTKIWRYISFTKLLSLLETNTLYFARADVFRDRFEGSYTQVNLKLRPELYKDYPQVNDFLSTMHKNITKQIFINCWHINENESSAMWETYSKNNEGIALRSTVKRLTKSLDNDKHHFVVSEVNYIDYKKDFIREDNAYAPFLNKRKSFEHEQELRAICFDPKLKYKKGVEIKIDINQLIETLYIAPTSKPWFKKLVKSILNKYECNIEVRQSDLEEDPVY